ncbi:hypothetical protein CCP4SC76_1450002 [Gammaproteobacteria bacterium]
MGVAGKAYNDRLNLCSVPKETRKSCLEDPQEEVMPIMWWTIIWLFLTLPVTGLADEPGVNPVPPADVTGFRSAHFGMSEEEVRKAIVKDFSIKKEAIKAEENPLDRTRILMIRVPDLLPKGGTAQVVYVLGYSKKKLIQVNVLWSKTSDSGIKPEQLADNAVLLGNHFETNGFAPDSITRNALLSSGEGVLVFRGTDKQGRMVLLLLRGDSNKDKPDQPKFTYTALQLFYVADPANPDIFRLSREDW